VPKSTVSRALARLEEALAAALVRRLSRGPALTEQGRQLAALAAPHIAGLRDAALALGQAVEEPYGTLRVTAPVDIAQVVLGPLMPAFLARYPRVGVEVDLTLRYVDLIGEGTVRAARARGPCRRRPCSRAGSRRRDRLCAGTTYLARRGRVGSKISPAITCCFSRSAARQLALAAAGVPGSVQGGLGGNDFFFLREAIMPGRIGPLPWFVARTESRPGGCSACCHRSTPARRSTGCSRRRSRAAQAGGVPRFPAEHAPRRLVALGAGNYRVCLAKWCDDEPLS
jgi:DNA-binding transcriptional LysR family regulator